MVKRRYPHLLANASASKVRPHDVKAQEAEAGPVSDGRNGADGLTI